MVLENQVAIVTGGGQGIGKAIAVRCASEGANIAVFETSTRPPQRPRRERSATLGAAPSSRWLA